jgi:WD40 repeat protein
MLRKIKESREKRRKEIEPMLKLRILKPDGTTAPWIKEPEDPTPTRLKIEVEFEKGLIAYDNQGNELWRWKFPIRPFFNSVDKLAISPNGKYIALSIRNMDAHENRIYFLDNTGNLLGEYQVEWGECNIAFSPDSEYVAVTDYHNVYLFRSNTGLLQWRYHVTPEEVDCISIASKGEYIIIGTSPDVVRDGRGKERLKGKMSICLLNKEGNLILKKQVDDLTHPWADFKDTKVTPNGKQLIVMTKEKILSFRLNLK